MQGDGRAVTNRIVEALPRRWIDRRRRDGRCSTGRGEPVADALVLRLVGGLHALHRAGADADLSRVFAGETTDPTAIADVLRSTLARHDAAIRPWLDGAAADQRGRAVGGLMTGLLHIAARYGPRVELLEIGSSAGLNLLIGHYGFDLGGTRVGRRRRR